MDGWLAGWFPDLARICTWGALSGAGTLAIYSVLSDQSAIGQLKRETRELRRQILGPELERSEVFTLGRRSLILSFHLLFKTGVPALLSALPVVVVVCWLSAYQSHRLNSDNMPVQVEILPTAQGVNLTPPEAFVREDETIGLIRGEKSPPVRFIHNGRIAYTGSPGSPPTTHVGKKVWWNIFFGNEAGYIDSSSALEEIRFQFPRKVFWVGLPMWMSTWEFAFFVCLGVVALAIKLIFGIK
jgi:hypothetical protein